MRGQVTQEYSGVPSTTKHHYPSRSHTGMVWILSSRKSSISFRERCHGIFATRWLLPNSSPQRFLYLSPSLCNHNRVGFHLPRIGTHAAPPFALKHVRLLGVNWANFRLRLRPLAKCFDPHLLARLLRSIHDHTNVGVQHRLPIMWISSVLVCQAYTVLAR